MAGEQGTGGPGTDGFSFWYYKPVAGPSIAFAIVFAISGLLHIYQNMIKSRTYRLGFLLPWAALIFTGGFITREIGARGNYGNLDVYIASTVLLFCAPPVYMGANCFILGRVLYYIPWLSPMHPGRVVSTFIGIDVLIEVLAGNGAAISSNMGNSASKQKLGVDLVKASLLLQLVLFVMLVSVVAIFQYRCSKAGIFKRNVRTILITLYVSCVLIFIRNIFRVVEFFQGWGQGVNRHEAYFWCFEVIPMFINTTLMNVLPPASNVPSSYKTYLARDGQTELRGPGWVDKRNFVLTIVDPFDIGGLIKGHDKKTMFWEEDGIEPMDLSVRHPKPPSSDSV